MKLLVSGYAINGDVSIGTYNTLNNSTNHTTWTDSINAPSFCAVAGDCLFTLTEKQDSGTVYIYRRRGEGYEMLLEEEVKAGSLCHICYSNRYKTAYFAAYEDGKIVSLHLKESNGIKGHEIKYTQQEVGKEISRAHCTHINQMQTRLYSLNIALDRLYCYDIIEGGNLHYSTYIQMKTGIGPRHMTFSSDEKYFYIITEYSNEVIVFETESMQEIQCISTLLEGETVKSNCSTLVLSNDGKHLYCANRGHDSITVFNVLLSGKLVLKENYKCYGNNPRHIALSCDNKHLLICNQDSNKVSICNIDKSSGAILDEVESFNFIKPSFVKEIE